jgi:hypothetical protein
MALKFSFVRMTEPYLSYWSDTPLQGDRSGSLPARLQRRYLLLVMPDALGLVEQPAASGQLAWKLPQYVGSDIS